MALYPVTTNSAENSGSGRAQSATSAMALIKKAGFSLADFYDHE